jgi:glycosyltransferase involved in cell wall biosynthesis
MSSVRDKDNALTTSSQKAKVLIVLNRAWNLYNFRAGLIRALCAQGYEVVVAAPVDAYAQRLASLGCRFVPLKMDNHGTSLVSELRLIRRLWTLFWREKPQVYLGYTVKPNTFGSGIAARMGIPVINNISGLGTAFLDSRWLNKLVRLLYRWGLEHSRRVFFQNKDDRQLFIDLNLVKPEQTGLLPGSGVDLRHFWASDLAIAERQNRDGLSFLMVGRLLVDKGILEYVDAARSIKYKYPNTRFQLLGFVDTGNPRGISDEQLHQWVHEGIIEYLGYTDDVRAYLSRANCVVLPSYREGTSRALLEAAAMGCPIIASDVPGCREALDPEVTGYLCEVRNASSLARQVERFVNLSTNERAAMGQAARKKMEREFDEQSVINAYLSEISQLVT